MDDQTGRVLAFPKAPDAIEIRHLRAFVAVAEELNFGRAAERLYVSQPALSRQVRSLERLVGCELLRRSTHRVELTLAGDALLDRARTLLSDLDEAVSATQSIGGELESRVARLWEPIADLALPDGDIETIRATYEELHARFDLPPDVTARSVVAGGVPGFVVTPAPELPTTLLYLHGGGYVMGSAYGFRPLAGALAAAAETAALIPEYRLAPEHPFPAAIEDVMRAYLWMVDSGVEPGRITVAGDSIAGGLVLSLLLSLRERGLPLPGGAVLMCPFVDLTGGTLDRLPPENSRRDQLRELNKRCVNAYLAGHPVDDPIVNPLRADLTGLPPLLIQTSTDDSAREDADLLTDRARLHGVDVRLQLYPGSTHVFHLFWSFLPEANDAIHQAGEFAREVAAGAAESWAARPSSATAG